MPLERISSSAPTGTQANCYSEDALWVAFFGEELGVTRSSGKVFFSHFCPY